MHLISILVRHFFVYIFVYWTTLEKHKLLCMSHTRLGSMGLTQLDLALVQLCEYFYMLSRAHCLSRLVKLPIGAP